jgi:pimeloyl-ACP methyl ester carboxylesterase
MPAPADQETPAGAYAPVNGLSMYYEVHGTGQPLLVLHGAYMTIETMGRIIPLLARDRQVIAVELQAHGRTADIGRPLRYELMADDAAALLRHLGIATADVYGYSMGGGAALQLAMRHPELVRKLVVVSASYTSDGAHPEMMPTIASITPELFVGTPWLDTYQRLAPNPGDFPTLVAKLKALDLEPFAWPSEHIRAITAPTLVVVGDSDGVRPEHAVQMFRLRGGGVFGDIVGLPQSQLAVLPATTHVGIIDRAEWLHPMITAFLEAPPPQPRGA